MRRASLVLGLVLLMPVSAGAEEKPPSYVRDVKPIFDNHCVRCHRPGKTKGAVDITSVAALLRGGKRGKVILAPGEPQHSPLVLTMQGRGKVMPPRRERKRPTTKEIALIREWIAGGAKDDSKEKAE
jgi:mono/diheme cytochrome c family protein